MRIALFSSAKITVSKENKILAQQIGIFLAQKNIIVVTGGSDGIPGLVVRSAFKAGAETEAYSPDENERRHNSRTGNLHLKYFKNHHFVPGFTARSLEMIKGVDGAIVVNGRMGTLSEFTIALEEGLDVVIIENTGGIADQLKKILAASGKEFPNQVIFTKDYQTGIEALIKIIWGR